METERVGKVLIVDDEEDSCYLFSEILRRRNIDTAYVNSLSDAVLVLQQDTPDLLFLDNKLSDGFGLDFIPYVKKNYPATKVVMITAQDGALEKKIARERGADFFIGKPLSTDSIIMALDNFSRTGT